VADGIVGEVHASILLEVVRRGMIALLELLLDHDVVEALGVGDGHGCLRGEDLEKLLFLLLKAAPIFLIAHRDHSNDALGPVGVVADDRTTQDGMRGFPLALVDQGRETGVLVRLRAGPHRVATGRNRADDADGQGVLMNVRVATPSLLFGQPELLRFIVDQVERTVVRLE